MSTPRYVKEAVLAYMERGDSKPLLQMYEFGIPVLEYPESMELVEKLIKGDRGRKRGGQPRKRDDFAKEDTILRLIAQLHGAGLGVFTDIKVNKDGKPYKKTACDVVAEIYGRNAKDLFNRIWKPNEYCEETQRHIDIGKDMRKKDKHFLDLFKKG